MYAPSEELLCELFADVLRLPAVRGRDDFFALGGNSLLAVRLVSRVRRTLGVELDVRQLFRTPTAAALSAQMIGAAPARTALRPAVPPARVPLSPGQRGLWFINQLDGAASTYVVPIALRLRGAVDRAALRLALADVVRRHEILRTVYPADNGEPWQRIEPVDSVGVELPVTGCPEVELAAVLVEDAGRPFDLTTDQPLRARLLVLGDRDHVLSLVIHHIACDGWSIRPLMRDLGVAYEARLHGRARASAPLPVRYLDYTLWHADLLGAEHDPDTLAARQLAYWRVALAGLPDEVTFPTDRPRPEAPGYHGAVLAFQLDANLHARTAELASATQTTSFMVLQAALVALMTASGAGTDIPIGTPMAGRSDDSLDELVGFFVNTVVLRNDTSGNPTFRELLGRVRRVALDAHAHHDLPFDRVVQVRNPTRSLARHPLFQVMLTLNEGAREVPPLAGLDVEWLTNPSASASFDISIDLHESAPSGPVPATLIYRTDLYDEQTAHRIAAGLVRVLDMVTTDPELRVDDLGVAGGAGSPPRAQLRTPDSTIVSVHSGGRQPRTLSEQRLCARFAEVLRLPDASIDDNFFDQGGHSLLAIRFLAGVHCEFGVRLSIKDLFEAPTVAGLAAKLGTVPERGDALAPLLALRATGDRPPLFCLPPAAGIGWSYSGLLRHLGQSQPVYALQARELSRPDVSPAALTETVEEHLARIRSVQPTGPYHLLGWSFGAVMAHALATRLQGVGERVATLSMLDGYPPRKAIRTPTDAADPEVLLELVRSLGGETKGLPAQLSAPDLVARLATAGSPLGDLDAATISAMVTAFARHHQLLRELTPAVFHGDVLFFEATLDKAAGSPTPDAWRPFMRGRLAVHRIPCTHGGMTGARSLEEVGAVLADWFDRDRAQRR